MKCWADRGLSSSDRLRQFEAQIRLQDPGFIEVRGTAALLDFESESQAPFRQRWDVPYEAADD